MQATCSQAPKGEGSTTIPEGSTVKRPEVRRTRKGDDIVCSTRRRVAAERRVGKQRVRLNEWCQNFPKQAEAYVSDIFGKGNEPPLLRTIIKPKDGWVMIEGDYKQAELFTLANLSQDENMLKALTTPGIDLHDKTAVESFGLKMFDESGNEVSEEYLVELAAKLGGTENDEYEHFMKTLVYVDAHGAKLSRSSFKNSLRVASKSINFGIA